MVNGGEIAGLRHNTGRSMVVRLHIRTAPQNCLDKGILDLPLFLVPLPVALSSVALSALPSALVDFVGVPAEKRSIVGRCTSRFLTTSERVGGCRGADRDGLVRDWRSHGLLSALFQW